MKEYSSSISLRCVDADTMEALSSVEDGKKVVADHAGAVASFTAGFHNGKTTENHRFGIVLTMDSVAAQAGTLTHPQIVNTIFEELVILFAQMGGPVLMHQVAEIRRRMIMENMVNQAAEDIGHGNENLN